MNLSIALTATRFGATIANHCRVLDLIKERVLGQKFNFKEIQRNFFLVFSLLVLGCNMQDEEGILRIVGAKVRDEVSRKEFNVMAKCVVNATGPFTDTIRKMDDASTPEICAPSAGVHIVLPGYYR